MIAAPGLDPPAALRLRLGNLYCAYGDALDEGALERWPDFFTEECRYQVIPRDNLDRGLPIALIYCESRDMLADRVTAIRETALYVPRLMRHFVSNIRLRAIGAGRDAPDRELCAVPDHGRPAVGAVPVRPLS